MIDNVIKIYKSKVKYITNRHGKRILSSYNYQLVVPNASAFDNYFVLNSLPNPYKCKIIIKTSRGLIELNFKAVFVSDNDKGIPKYMKFVCSKCHITGSLKEKQREHKIQPNLMKEEIDHNVFIISKYKD